MSVYVSRFRFVGAHGERVLSLYHELKKSEEEQINFLDVLDFGVGVDDGMDEMDGMERDDPLQSPSEEPALSSKGVLLYLGTVPYSLWQYLLGVGIPGWIRTS